MSGSRTGTRHTRWRRAKLSLVALVVGLLTVEGAVRGLSRSSDGRTSVLGIPLLPLIPAADEIDRLLASLPTQTAGRYFAEDAELGWVIAPNGVGVDVASNAQGARSAPDRVYDRVVPPGKVRLLTFGDSFTHGDEVGLSGTWQFQLEAAVPGFEVVNFGVPGYGMDQAYLRCKRELGRLETTHALLCIWPEDIGRCLNVYRFLLTGGGDYLQKPRMVVDGEGGLQVRGVEGGGARRTLLEQLRSRSLPADLLAADRWYQPGDLESAWWHPWRTLRLATSLRRKLANRELHRRSVLDEDAEAVMISTAIARAFAEAVRASGADPWIVLIPQREHLAEYPGGDRAMPMVARLGTSGAQVIDLSPAFVDHAAQGLYLPSGHLSEAGNGAVARELAKRLWR